MTDKVVFHLAKYFPPRTMKPQDMCDSRTLYQRIKDGSKTSEYRENVKYWLFRLVSAACLDVNGTKPQDLTPYLCVHKAWFVEGYPKNCLPRLEADITKLFYHPLDVFLEICFTNVKEVMSTAMRHVQEQNEQLGRILQAYRAQETSIIFVTPKTDPTFVGFRTANEGRINLGV
jgi:hypothetical protein